MERGGLLGIRGAPELKGEEGRGAVDGRIGRCLTKGTLTDRAQPMYSWAGTQCGQFSD